MYRDKKKKKKVCSDLGKMYNPVLPQCSFSEVIFISKAELEAEKASQERSETNVYMSKRSERKRLSIYSLQGISEAAK